MPPALFALWLPLDEQDQDNPLLTYRFEAFKQGLVVVDGGHFGTESPVVDDLCRRLQAASEERQWGIDCQRDPTSQDMIRYLI